MVRWYHRLDGHEFEQALGVGDGQGSLECCSPWGRKESDTTERLNNKKMRTLPRTREKMLEGLSALRILQFRSSRQRDRPGPPGPGFGSSATAAPTAAPSSGPSLTKD